MCVFIYLWIHIYIYIFPINSLLSPPVFFPPSHISQYLYFFTAPFLLFSFPSSHSPLSLSSHPLSLSFHLLPSRFLRKMNHPVELPVRRGNLAKVAFLPRKPIQQRNYPTVRSALRDTSISRLVIYSFIFVSVKLWLRISEWPSDWVTDLLTEALYSFIFTSVKLWLSISDWLTD